MRKQTDEPREVKKFSETFASYRMGTYDIEAGQKQAAVVRAVRETGKKGSLTIKLDFEPDSDGTQKIKITIAGKIPEVSGGTVLVFDDEDGNLHRSDPMQADMGFGEALPKRIESRAESAVFDRSRAGEAVIVE